MSVTTCAPPALKRKYSHGKRTNSLGWAKADCHTCSSIGRHCDRRRPRCSACLAEGIVCAGYVQELNWERGSKHRGKSRLKGVSKKSDIFEAKDVGIQLPQPSSFVFVDQIKPPERSKRKPRTGSIISNPTVPCSPISEVEEISRRGSTSSAWESISEQSPGSFTSWSLTTTTSTPSPVFDFQQIPFSIPAKIDRHSGDLEDSLSFYNNCFSYITLTFPVNINPWQAVLPQIHDGIPCVRYAAIALAQRQQAHLSGRPENLGVLKLKDRALSMFANNLNTLPFESGISTSLLLIALDYAESGYSNWAIHLRGAYRILESNGGIACVECRPNLRSQIAMLIWYDIIAALISRSGPVFPRTYLEALMTWQSESEWSVLAPNGLPDDMFIDMHDLAVAASHPDLVTHDYLTTLETKISTAEINAQGDQYLHSMSQAWKLGLLLYCARVFPDLSIHATSRADADADTDTDFTTYPAPAPATTTTAQATCHALGQQILTITESLPPHSAFQKQCLLPIVLAACEMTDEDDQEYRRIAMEYGDRWKRKTGIWIWDSSAVFLNSVWSVNDALLEVDGLPRVTVPWTQVFSPGVEHGFLFG